MAFKGIVQAECPNCHEEFEAEVWSVIRGDLDDEICERLLAGEINMLACPQCGRVFYFEHPLIFLDPGRELLAFIYPESYREDEARWRGEIEQDTKRFQAALPAKDRRVYAPQLYFGIEPFIAAMRPELERREETEVAEAVWTELGLATFDVNPSWAREHGAPAALPLAEGADLRKRLVVGLEKLTAANDRLTTYAAYLAGLRKPGGAAPPGAERPRKAGKKSGR